MEDTPKPKSIKAAPVKRYYTRTGNAEHIPGLGFVVTDEMLQRPFVIRAIENFEQRTGKQVFGTAVVLR